MFSFFEGIVDLIGAALQYVFGIFDLLAMLVNMMSVGFVYIGAAIGFLPSFVLAPVVSLIVFVVVLNVLNKGS